MSPRLHLANWSLTPIVLNWSLTPIVTFGPLLLSVAKRAGKTAPPVVWMAPLPFSGAPGPLVLANSMPHLHLRETPMHHSLKKPAN